MRINESGRSMIEMLGVLAIIGVLSVGGIAGYTKAMNKYRTNKVVDQVTMIVTNIRTLYAMQRNYNGLDQDNALEMGVIPDELGTTTTDLTNNNPFNGAVKINAVVSGMEAGSSSSDKKAFEVAFTGLSKEACVALATGDWGSGHSAGLIAIGAYDDGTSTLGTEDTAKLKSNGSPCDGDASNIACAGNATNGVPMAVTKAATACACNTGNSCSVVWKYF